MNRTKWAKFVLVGGVFAGQALLGQHGHNGDGGGRGGSVETSTSQKSPQYSSVQGNNAARASGPNLGGTSYPIRTDVPTPTGLVAPAAAYTGITPGALKPLNNGRVGRGGFGYGYPGFIGAPFLPYLGTDPTPSFPSFSEQAEEISARQEAQRQQDTMAQQLQQVSSELRQLRESQMYGVPQPGVNSPMPQPAPAPVAPAEPAPAPVPITVVLQNGSRLTVSNYAVMNGVLWDFSKQPARKIPVSSINVAASQSATEENGADFPNLTSANRR